MSGESEQVISTCGMPSEARQQQAEGGIDLSTEPGHHRKAAGIEVRNQKSTSGSDVLPVSCQEETVEGISPSAEPLNTRASPSSDVCHESVHLSTQGAGDLSPGCDPQQDSVNSDPSPRTEHQATHEGDSPLSGSRHKRTKDGTDPATGPEHQPSQAATDLSRRPDLQRTSRDCSSSPQRRLQARTQSGRNSPSCSGHERASRDSDGTQRTSASLKRGPGHRQQKSLTGGSPGRRPGPSSGLEVAEARRRLLEVEGRRLVLSQLESHIQQLHQVFVQTELRVVGRADGIDRLGTGMSQAEIYISAHGQRLKKSLRRQKKPRLLASALGLAGCVPWAGRLHRRAEPIERVPHSPAPRRGLPTAPCAIMRLVRKKRAEDKSDI
ncbi:TMF-regulated nuclear protein 1 [Lissotriton helveticus]